MNALVKNPGDAAAIGLVSAKDPSWNATLRTTCVATMLDAGHATNAPPARAMVVADLPEPNPSESVDNGPNLVPRPEGAWPIAPAGFTVQLYAGGGNTNFLDFWDAHGGLVETLRRPRRGQ